MRGTGEKNLSLKGCNVYTYAVFFFLVFVLEAMWIYGVEVHMDGWMDV